MQHQKHHKLARPDTGHFARREWALLGAPCGQIQQLSKALALALTPRFRVAYIDADHAAADKGDQAPGFALEYTDKINFQRVDFPDQPNPWQQRALFNELDLVLVNGNHFTAARQLLLLDRRKFESLQRKTERLTQVDAFIRIENGDHAASPADLPETVKECLPNWAEIPVLSIDDTPAVAAFLEDLMAPAPLQALLLTGGKSQRMGQDKATLDYHGMPQWKYLREQLNLAGIENVFLSCRAEQAAEYSPEPVITDTFLELGPMGAILSAFRHNPNVAWLVLACDLPLLDAATLRYLIDNRKAAALATAFRQPPGTDEKADGFPEPLITIWEPAIYPVMLQFLGQGVSCPRKVLINSRTHLLDAPDPRALMNVNTPGERDAVLGQIQTHRIV